jgi:nucleotide-binding universal stress UspA family protein
VIEAVDPAAAIVEFADTGGVNHILLGARQNSVLRKLLGGVSARVAAEATCTVTVVRAAQPDSSATAISDETATQPTDT